jgi:hypothetical protein
MATTGGNARGAGDGVSVGLGAIVRRRSGYTGLCIGLEWNGLHYEVTDKESRTDSM